MRGQSLMSSQDLFERVLTSLHACVLDGAGWPAVSGLIDELCGAKGNGLVFGDGTRPDDVDVFFAQFCFRGQRDTEFEREYFTVYYPGDERVQRLLLLPDSRITPVRTLYNEEERKTSLVYNEMLPNIDSLDGFNVRLDGPDGMGVVVVFSDPVDRDGWTSERVETIGRLLPPIRQFVRVKQALVDARALGASPFALLDNVRWGVIQLDRRGRIAAVNDRARALLLAGDGLCDRGGHLRASLPEEDKTLQRLLARALPAIGGPGEGGSMRLGRRDSLPRLVLHVNPANDAATESAQVRIGALVLVVDPAWRLDLEPAQVGELLGLTPAESLVAVLYAQGKSIDEIAVSTGRRRTTIKWHLRHIYDKHHLSRQVELAQLLLSVADVPGVRR